MRAQSGRTPSEGVLAACESNPVLTPEGTEDATTFSSVWLDGETYHMFYYYNDAGDKQQIGHATSLDGETWTKDSAHNPILTKGAAGDWDNDGACVPSVWKEGSNWYMLYRGKNTDGSFRIGLATATDPGHWTKSGSNPVYTGTSAWELDSNGLSSLDPWGIIKVGSTYYAQINSVSPADAERKIGIVYSTNLTSWTASAGNPIFTGGRFCCWIFAYGEHYYAIVTKYGGDGMAGGNYSYLELWRSLSPEFSRHEQVRAWKHTGAAGEWDAHDQDTPCLLTDTIARNSFPGGILRMYFAGESAAGAWATGLCTSSDIAGSLTFI